MMRLQTSFYNHLRPLYFHISGTFLMLIPLAYFKFDDGIIIICSIVWAVYTLPIIYLHTEYYLKNKDEIYEINSDHIILQRDCTKKTYNKKDLKKVILYKSASMDDGGMPIAPMEQYYYARIIINSGEELIITQLLTPEVEKAVRQLKGVPVERVKRPFCPIFWKRLGNPDI